MLIVISKSTTKKITQKIIVKETTWEWKRHTVKYLFNAKEGRNWEIEDITQPKYTHME